MRRSFLFIVLTTLFVAFAAMPDASAQRGKKKDKNKSKDRSEVKDERADMELRALFIEAQKERMLGNLFEAENKLKQCLALDKDNHAVYYDLALISDQQSRVSDAIVYAEKATELDPTNVWYQTLLAEIHVSRGDMDSAEKTYEKILQAHPELYEYYYELAMVRFRKGDYTKSIDALDQIEERLGPSDELLQQKQMLYIELGELDKAKKDIQEMIDANPRQARYYGMMAEIYKREGDQEKAMEYYQKILEFDPDNGMVQLSLYEYFKNNGQDARALEAITKAFRDETIDIDSKVSILLNYYTVTELDKEQLAEAYSLAKTLKEVYPEEAKSHAIYGDFLLRDARYEEARDAFSDAVELDPARPAIWNQLLQLDSELRDYTSLEAHSAEAIELYPTMPFYYLFNGIALSQLDQSSEAIEMLETGKEFVLDDDATLLEFYSALGEAYNAAGRYADSDKAYDRALNILPDNVFVLNNYSYYLSLREERLDAAEQMAARANELSPGMASFQDTHAWVLYKAGKYQEAKELLEEALANGGSESGTIVEHYGDVLYKLGDSSGALEQWKKAQGLGDASDEIDGKVSRGSL